MKRSALKGVTLACVITMLLLQSCTEQPQRTVISFWHFWSEPAQHAALQRQVDEYAKTHPDVDIRLTDLAWSDGKAKLQLAFNAHQQPDIVHLGMDWFPEFSTSGVLSPISAPVPYGKYGALWVINARALLRWDSGAGNGHWGLCANDNHNVLKRTLPIIWKAGAKAFYSTLPISRGMDSTLVSALWYVRGLVLRGAIIEQGRSLDQRFLNGEVGQLYSGAWMLDQAEKQHIQGFSVIPTRSILNGDVLGITRNSNHHKEAQDFVTWLTSYEQAKQFCMDVSDAGIPASPLVHSDTTFRQTAWQRGFVETIHLSSPLPNSPILLSIEPVIEHLIEESYRASDIKEIEELVRHAKYQVESLEASPHIQGQ